MFNCIFKTLADIKKLTITDIVNDIQMKEFHDRLKQFVNQEKLKID